MKLTGGVDVGGIEEVVTTGDAIDSNSICERFLFLERFVSLPVVGGGVLVRASEVVGDAEYMKKKSE